MRAGGLAPATLVEGVEGVGPLDARSMRAGGLAPATPRPRRLLMFGVRSFNEGRGVSPGDTWRCQGMRGGEMPFNEGRGVSPGDTRLAVQEALVGLLRSMRAGGLAPATLGQTSWEPALDSSFNEGRGVSPGDT